MKQFLSDNFLLNTKTAEILYHEYAKKQPIFDFHCHLNPQEIYEDKQYADLTEVWLGGDHYKWRLMREMGVDESYITGDKPSKEKFLKYAEVMPYAIGNPLYHWTHLELQRYFGIDLLLNPQNAQRIWDLANDMLKTMTARKMIEANNVKAIYTTDDPADDLKWHKLLNEDKSFKVVVKPAFRPDKAINIELSMFFDWLKKLEATAGKQIKSFDEFLNVLTERVQFFDQMGCVCSDHALDVVVYKKGDKSEAARIFDKALKGGKIEGDELAIYKGFMLVFFGKLYAKHKWVQQYHIGALRNASSRYMRLLGADTGFDAIEDQPFAHNLVGLMDELDSTDELPKTILYCLNPRDNEVLSAVKNCFQKSGTQGKIQFGSAWWFNDQKDGMTRQMEAFSQLGLLSKFVGMLTDSRSFLSYTRHEYFRRLLCDRFGSLIENGEYPCDIEFVGKIVEDICYNNAVKYFTK